MNEIPEERQITKRQLWERGEAHYTNYQNLLQEISSRIDGVEMIVTQRVLEAIKKYNEKWESNRMELNGNAQTVKKDLEKIVNDAITRMQQAMNSHIAKVDQKIQEAYILLEDKTDRKITDRLQSIAQESRLIFEAIRQYKTDTEQQVKKYHTDTGSQLRALAGKVESVMKKFKLVSKGLS